MGEGKHMGSGVTIITATVTSIFTDATRQHPTPPPLVATATTTYTDIVATIAPINTISGDVHARGASTPTLSVIASVHSFRHAMLCLLATSHLFRRDCYYLHIQII
jgi:hypothetical protein